MVKNRSLFSIYARNINSAWRQARHTDRTICPHYVVTRIELLGKAKYAKGKNKYWVYGHRRLRRR